MARKSTPSRQSTMNWSHVYATRILLLIIAIVMFSVSIYMFSVEKNYVITIIISIFTLVAAFVFLFGKMFLRGLRW